MFQNFDNNQKNAGGDIFYQANKLLSTESQSSKYSSSSDEEFPKNQNFQGDSN